MADYKLLRTYLNNDISQLDLFEERVNELAKDGYKVISTNVQNSMYLVMMEKLQRTHELEFRTISPIWNSVVEKELYDSNSDTQDLPPVKKDNKIDEVK